MVHGAYVMRVLQVESQAVIIKNSDPHFIDDTQRPNSPTFYRALANGNALPCLVPPCPLFTVVLIDGHMVVMQRNM